MVKQVHGYEAKSVMNGPKVNSNFKNQIVEQKKKELGAFNYAKFTPNGDGVKRTFEAMKTFKIGNDTFKYEGEWND